MSFRPLVIAVIGTTGVGKSDLAIRLAKSINGEIINADAMQVYRHLSIITNKVLEPDQDGIPHHLMNMLEPSEEYSVRHFLRDADGMIKDIWKRRKVPIVVGGTHYYIKSLLWRSGSDGGQEKEVSCAVEVTKEEVANMSDDSVLEMLRQVDPVMAQRWHVKDVRKTRRSLEVYAETGRRHSDIILEQKTKHQAESRYESIIFWPYMDLKGSSQQLDSRVDIMVQKGMVNELKELQQIFNESKESFRNSDGTPDYTRGIFQTIGFKEFHEFLQTHPSSTENELPKECVDEMKNATRRYARKQLAYIRNQILPNCQTIMNNPTHNPRLYLMSTSLDYSERDMMMETASNICLSIINSKHYPIQTSRGAEVLNTMVNQVNDTEQDVRDWKRYICEKCQKEVHGVHQWKEHIRSRSHKKRCESLRRKEKQMLIKRLKVDY